MQKEGDDVVYRCRCGDEYVLGGERRFLGALRDGGSGVVHETGRFGVWVHE